MKYKLGKQLWKQIEKPQGYSYLSDSIETLSDEQVYEMAKAALVWHEESAKVLREFVKHVQLSKNYDHLQDLLAKAHLTQRAPDLAVRGPQCVDCGGVVFHAKSCPRVKPPSR